MRNSPYPEITMLSATADHAIRAVLVLARAHRFMRADEIADATGAPHNYMAKTLNALAKTGLVTSARGPAGGFTLAVAPSAIPIARIIDLFDVPRVETRCMLGNVPCDPANPCAAHECWTRVMRARREPLLTTTVADLLAGATLPTTADARDEKLATSSAA
jgi:Rrf2 family transcriptional regulator, iron-sulfur cluster assembly transcription factor